MEQAAAGQINIHGEFLVGVQMGQPIMFSIGCSQPWRVSITRLSVGRRRAIRREQTDNFQAGLIP
jgi:hypothetical protein